MKYGYANANNSDLIRGYRTLDNKIVITFLDGTSHEIPLTKEAEEGLLEKMIAQALERSKSSALFVAKKARIDALAWAFIDFGLYLVTIVNIIAYDSNFWRILSSILGCISGVCIVINGVNYKFKTEEIEELEKYDIYLAMRETLEEYITNPNLYNGVKNEQGRLNINTLDYYSLSDIKIIATNLDRLKNSSYYFKDDSNGLTLKNKIG